MEPLKELFNRAYYERLANALRKVEPSFPAEKFIKKVTAGLDERSLNERLRNTSVVLHDFLPKDFLRVLEIFRSAVQILPTGYTALVFPDYISLYGKQHKEPSLQALAYLTSFGSSEFAIREFLKEDFNHTIRVMESWSKDKNVHVRRLASEGSRARLPWSFKLDRVINDPSSTAKILENLKSDPELYVKKSVANHLNDLSKDNPDYMIRKIGEWDLTNKHTAWIVKHASRTLIKKGDPWVLSLFSFDKAPKVQIDSFKLHSTKLKLGEELIFSFDISSKKAQLQRLVIDYRITYTKQKGTTTKVFKLKELELKPNQIVHIRKKQLFKDFSTRKHFHGNHAVEVLINGKVYGKIDFHLHVSGK